jgi:hemolysin activation/secretion protein
MAFNRSTAAPLAAGLLTLFVTLPAVAQDPPPAAVDPGQTLEQRERERRFYTPPEEEESDDPGLDEPWPYDDWQLPEKSDQSFELKGVRFDESAFISADRLQAIAEPCVGETVTFSDINEMVGRINAIYRERGQITARAIVPPQRIEGGILRVRLVEGKVGRIDLQGRRYTDEAFLTEAIGVGPGAVIDVPALRERMRRFNRITPLALGARLRAGEDFGESDVVVGVQEPPRYTGQVFVDTNGSETTGEEQYGVYGVWNGPFRRADRFSAYVVGSEGATSMSLTYAAPVSATGGMLTGTVALAETEIVEGGFADLDITGESTQVSLEYLAPGWRSGDTTVDWLARIGGVESDTDAAGRPIADTTIERIALGLQGRGAGWGGRWFLQQELISASSENVLGDEQDYLRWPGRGSWSGPGVLGARARLSGTWQYSSDERIASPSQFQIGGVGTVRGYENGIQSAARGVAVSGELHWQPDWIADSFVFADIGHVDGISPDSETISSVGAGLRWRRGSWQADASLAAALDTVVPDQDDYRLHLRLAYAFGAGD